MSAQRLRRHATSDRSNGTPMARCGRCSTTATSVVSREQVQSLRKAKRRVTDLVLAAADNYPTGPLHPATPSRLGSLENKPLPAQRRPMAVAHFA